MTNHNFVWYKSSFTQFWWIQSRVEYIWPLDEFSFPPRNSIQFTCQLELGSSFFLILILFLNRIYFAFSYSNSGRDIETFLLWSHFCHQEYVIHQHMITQMNTFKIENHSIFVRYPVHWSCCYPTMSIMVPLYQCHMALIWFAIFLFIHEFILFGITFSLYTLFWWICHSCLL